MQEQKLTDRKYLNYSCLKGAAYNVSPLFSILSVSLIIVLLLSLINNFDVHKNKRNRLTEHH